MKRWIFENLGLKLLAFLIAFSLWAYVGSRQILERKVVLHLELTEIPAGMTVDSSVRTTVPVVLTGRKESVLEVDPDDLTAVVSLKSYTKDKKDLLVHPLVQPLPSGVAATVSAIHVHLISTNNHK